jgi:hypothetical protein
VLETRTSLGSARELTRAAMYGEAAEVVVADFALACMQPGSHLDAEWLHSVGDRASAADTACGTVECCEHPVAGGVDFASVEALELAAYRGVVLIHYELSNFAF